MSQATIAPPPVDKAWKPPVSIGKFAMWTFLGTEIMFFTGLIGAYIVLRMGADKWPNPADYLAIDLTAFNTFLLICSSVSLVVGLKGIQNGNRTKLFQMMALTTLLGAIFVGVQAYEYQQLIHHGFVPAKGLFQSCFYIMTGFHGMHVSVGVLMMAYLTWKSSQGAYSPENYDAVEIVGLYWHFVDLVWILLFTVVYLM